jgi:molybdopterin-biosynthesis enzyme MoeA-like protein
VTQAWRRSPIVITTGGLGPTVDDPTREAIAVACGRPLEFRPELWEQIIARFKRFGRYPGENNRKQAYAPQGALALENPVGTAPCFVVEHAGGVLACLPGVPREMEHMLAHAVLPYLREKFQLTHVIKAKILRTVGLGESVIDEKIGDLETLANPAVGLAAHAGQTDIRITATAPGEAEALALIAPIEERIRRELGNFVYGEGKESLEEVVGRLLAEHEQTLMIAEAGANGQLAARLAAMQSAQTTPVYRGRLAHRPTPESPFPAEIMADWAVSLNVHQTDEAITLHMAIKHGGEMETRSLGYGGPPTLAPTWASTAALNLLRLALLKTEG